MELAMPTMIATHTAARSPSLITEKEEKDLGVKMVRVVAKAKTVEYVGMPLLNLMLDKVEDYKTFQTLMSHPYNLMQKVNHLLSLQSAQDFACPPQLVMKVIGVMVAMQQ